MNNNDGAGQQAEVKVPGKWGLSEARFFASVENESVIVHLRSGETLAGFVTGLDMYGVGLEIDGKPPAAWIPKHAIDYITRS